jgi:hypothetical protein
MKRSYEDVFGQNQGASSVLADLSFKFINQQAARETCRGSFASVQSLAVHNDSNRKLDYDAYLNLEESALLDAARKIEKSTEEPVEQPNLAGRDIRRVKRPQATLIGVQAKNQQTPAPVSTSQPIPPELLAVELKDKNLEKIEIEYLEKMTQDCRLPVSADNAQMMKKYTDLLLNVVTDHKEKEFNKTKAENIVLKKAFRIQSNITDKVRESETSLKSELEQAKFTLQQAAIENRILSAKLREYQIREAEESNSQGFAFGPRRDIEGF